MFTSSNCFLAKQTEEKLNNLTVLKKFNRVAGIFLIKSEDDRVSMTTYLKSSMNIFNFQLQIYFFNVKAQVIFL